ARQSRVALLLGRARVDQVVLDVRGRAARGTTVLGPVAREQDAPPVQRGGDVRLAAIALLREVSRAGFEGAVLVGEALDRLAPVQLHGDDLVAEPFAVLRKVVDVRPARAVQVARRDVVRIRL